MDELLSSITKLEGDHVAHTLEALLQKAKVALKPAKNPSIIRNTNTLVDKKALSRGILALLQHASNFGDDNVVTIAVNHLLGQAIKQHPWLWERFVRFHMTDLLQFHGAVEFLTNCFASGISGFVIGRGWKVLASQLRQVDPSVLFTSPSLGVFHRAAFKQVTECFRVISSDLNIITSSSSHNLNPTMESARQIHILPAPHLPSSLYVLLFLSGIADEQGRLPPHADPSCIDGAAKYASALVDLMCKPDELVNNMLQLRNERHLGSVSEVTTHKDDTKRHQHSSTLSFDEESLTRIHVAMQTTTVLLEAVLTSPHLFNTPDRKLTDNNDSILSMVGCLLAARLEFMHVMMFAGTRSHKLMKNLQPPPWSLHACEEFLDLCVVEHPTSPAVTLPPALIAQALDLVQSSLDGHHAEYRDVKLKLLEKVLKVHNACFTGVLNPHVAVQQGIGHQAAANMTHRLHALLLSKHDDDREQVNAHASSSMNIKYMDVGKVQRENGVRALNKKKRKKGNSTHDGDDPAHDAVADVMRLISSNARHDAARNDSVLDAKQKQIVVVSNGKKRIVPQAVSQPSLAIKADEDNNNRHELLEEEKEELSEREIEEAMNTHTNATLTSSNKGGRILMSSSLDLSDAAREALWKAYIADKEMLVEMMGDSAYQEWYDEDEHPIQPLRDDQNNRHHELSWRRNIDDAFDEIFGKSTGTNDVTSAQPAFFPNSTPEMVMVYPWQASLAATLPIICNIMASLQITTDMVDVLVPMEQRKTCTTAVLRILEPDHGRNAWMSALKSAETQPLASALLYVVFRLRTLVHRTGRRTAPSVVAGFLSLARLLLQPSLDEYYRATRKVESTSQHNSNWSSIQHVGHIVQSSLCQYPRLTATAFNETSARALIPLSIAGMEPFKDVVTYISALIVLLVCNCTASQNLAGRQALSLNEEPAWMTSLVSTCAACTTAPQHHPLLQASSRSIKHAAIEELGSVLVKTLTSDKGFSIYNGGGVSDAVSSTSVVVPIMEACACFVVYNTLSNELNLSMSNVSSPVPTQAAEQQQSPIEHAIQVVTHSICSVLNESAQRLSLLLDVTKSTATLEAASAQPSSIDSEIKDRSSLLAIGLEFIDVLNECHKMEGEIEGAGLAQSACIELLRTLDEDCTAYTCAVQGMESAPTLTATCLSWNTPDACVMDAEKRGGDEEEDQECGNGAHVGGGEHRDMALPTAKLSSYQRRKRLNEIQNPYLRVIVAESRRTMGDAADGELSDLEDFIVANPDRDYEEFIENHFPMADDDDDDSDYEDEDDDDGE